MDKSAIRRNIRSLRLELTAQQVELASIRVFQKVRSLHEMIRAQRIALYMSNENEIDTQLILNWLVALGKTVCLPVIDQHSLLFYEYHPQRLVTNQFSIVEPDKSCSELYAIEDLDLIAVPLVAFDRERYRLGRGGGYYDRALSDIRGRKHRPFLLALAYAMQEIEDCKPQVHDVRMDCIITP